VKAEARNWSPVIRQTAGVYMLLAARAIRPAPTRIPSGTRVRDARYWRNSGVAKEGGREPASLSARRSAGTGPGRGPCSALLADPWAEIVDLWIGGTGHLGVPWLRLLWRRAAPARVPILWGDDQEVSGGSPSPRAVVIWRTDGDVLSVPRVGRSGLRSWVRTGNRRRVPRRGRFR